MKELDSSEIMVKEQDHIKAEIMAALNNILPYKVNGFVIFTAGDPPPDVENADPEQTTLLCIVEADKYGNPLPTDIISMVYEIASFSLDEEME